MLKNKLKQRKSLWQIRDFQRYFFTYILLFTIALTIGTVIVTQVNQKNRKIAEEKQWQVQGEKIVEMLDSAWDSTTRISDILKNSVWVQKYKSESDVFDPEFDTLTKNDCSQFLTNICAFSDFIRDIAVLYGRKDTAVTPKGWFTLDEYQHYVSEYLLMPDYFVRRSLLGQVDWSGTIKPAGFTGFQDIYLVYARQLDLQDSPRMIVAIYIDKENLRRSLYRVCGEQVTNVRIVDEQGNEVINAPISESNSDTKTVLKTFSSENTLLSYEVSFVPETATLMGGAAGYLLLLILAMAGGIISYVMANIQYTPVGRLVNRVYDRVGPGETSQGMQAIENGIDKLFNENEALEQSLVSYRTVLREQTNVQLLRGYFSDNMSQALDVHNTPFLCDYTYVVLVLHQQQDSRDDPSEAVQERLRFLLIIRQTLQTLQLGQTHFELVENIEENAAVIAEFQTLPSKEIVMELASTLNDVLTAEDMECGIYVARPRKGLIGLSASYQAAIETLRTQKSSRGVIYAQPHMEYYYPLDWENQLVRAIREGNTLQAETILHQLYEENHRLNLSRPLIQRVSTLLYETMHRIIMESKLSTQIFQEPHYTQNLEQVFKEANLWVKKLCEEMDRRKKEAATKVDRSLVSYVDANIFDPDLSLNLLSDRFGVSNASISRIFKKAANDNFYSYVTRKRMERAKELLRLRGYCPAEIANEVGYDNDYSFKRAFQRTYGISPKDYVNQHCEETV